MLLLLLVSIMDARKLPVRSPVAARAALSTARVASWPSSICEPPPPIGIGAAATCSDSGIGDAMAIGKGASGMRSRSGSVWPKKE